MKVVALNPPFLPMFSRASRSPAVTRSSTLYYPFFLAYATGVLERDGHEVRLFDAPAARWDREDTLRRVRAEEPDLVVVDTSTPSIENDAEVALALRQATGAMVVGVGTHVSALPEETLDRHAGFDLLALREYEYTLRDVARAGARDPLALSDIPGLCLRDPGGPRRTPPRAPIESLDELPFVSGVYKRHLAPWIDSYFYGANLHPVVSILGGRGCPHQCAYCVYPQTMMGNRYRLRSVGNLVDELQFIARELPQVQEVFLEDDTLTVVPERARAIAREIVRRGLRITWSTNSRADADYETLRLMHEAGCRLLCVGFESGDQRVLDGIGKNIRLESYFRFREDARRAGVLIHGCFMFGNAGDTPESMKRTADLAIRLDPDTAQFYPIMVYPGTRAYERAMAEGQVRARSYREWLTPRGLHNCVVATDDFAPQEIAAFAERARRRFYLRPRYVFAKAIQFARHPRERRRLWRGGVSLFSKLLGWDHV